MKTINLRSCQASIGQLLRAVHSVMSYRRSRGHQAQTQATTPRQQHIREQGYKYVKLSWPTSSDATGEQPTEMGLEEELGILGLDIDADMELYEEASPLIVM